MGLTSPASSAAAARLLADSTSHAANTAETATAVADVFRRLQSGLGRWIGTASYTIVYGRALAMARVQHLVLGDLGQRELTADVLLAQMNLSGQPNTISGLTELIATIIELLGRLIGHEMAVQLVEHLGPGASGSSEHTPVEAPQDG